MGRARVKSNMLLDPHFQNRHWNRHEFPVRHVLVCEDDIDQQAAAARRMSALFGAQGKVHVSFVSGGRAAAAILATQDVHVVILDHDMPIGNGKDLMDWMRDNGFLSGPKAVPVVTFSGLDPNNDVLMEAGASHRFSKNQVNGGEADGVLMEILGLPQM